MVTPTLLLALTVASGIGMVLHTPTWQASIPELVPRSQLTNAIALGSISFNLARSAGPALGGIVVASIGTWAAFALNAVSFAGVLSVLTVWRRDRSESTEGQSFLAAMREGISYVTHEPTLRVVLTRVVFYVVPASAIWSLLPLVARDMLQWTSVGYGLLVGSIGIGAVAAATVMPSLRSRCGVTGILALSHAITSLACLLMATLPASSLFIAWMLCTGAGWMMSLTTLNATAQLTLPANLRARGMACYLTAFSIAIGAGAILWGYSARLFGLPVTLLIAGIAMALLGIIGHRFSSPLSDHGYPTKTAKD
jgi:predicted MFS family arabinose efflux permease